MRARFDLPLGDGAPTRARHVTTEVLLSWGYADGPWMGSVALVVTELVSNAVRHGGGCVSYTVEAGDGDVRVSVADGSSVVPRRRDATGGGGYGLMLIERLTEEWGVADHEGGKLVWARLRDPA